MGIQKQKQEGQLRDYCDNADGMTGTWSRSGGERLWMDSVGRADEGDMGGGRDE